MHQIFEAKNKKHTEFFKINIKLLIFLVDFYRTSI